MFDVGRFSHPPLGAPRPARRSGGRSTEGYSLRFLRAQRAGASFCGKPLGARLRLGRGLAVGGGRGGRTRGPSERAAQPETFSQTSGGGLAARSAGAAQRELQDSASCGGRVEHARAGLLVGTRSPCGSALAAAAKMPALRPAALRALLWLWLCGAGPAHGEYRAPGETIPLCLCAPGAASSTLPRPSGPRVLATRSVSGSALAGSRVSSPPAEVRVWSGGRRGLAAFPAFDTRIGRSVWRRSWAWGLGLGEVEAAVGELVWQRAEPHD